MAIQEITPGQARERQARGAVLVDVREAHERAGGQAEGSLGIARVQLEMDPAPHLPRRDAEILLICQGGARSLLAAQALDAAGYRNLSSVVGGTSRWLAEGLPVVNPVLDALHFWAGLEWVLEKTLGLKRQPDTSVPGNGPAPEWITEMRKPG